MEFAAYDITDDPDFGWCYLRCDRSDASVPEPPNGVYWYNYVDF